MSPQRPRATARSANRLARYAASASLALAVVLGGCGDSGFAPVNTALQESEVGSNVVLRNDSLGVEILGEFESVPGYLSQSPTVLRSAGAGSVIFHPEIRRSGYYEIFTWWPQTGGAGIAAEVAIRHIDGESKSAVDQSAFGGQWNSLGIFRFDPKTPASILFTHPGSAPMLVDAIRIQFVGDERPQLVLRTGELPIAEQNRAYAARLEGSGGVAPYSYRIVEGSLPAGLELDGTTGIISGMPARIGRGTMSLEVVDAVRGSAIGIVDIDVVEAADSPTIVRPMRGSSVAKATAIDAKSADLSSLASVVAAMQEGEWSKVNVNDYSSVWAPEELRPLFGWGNPTPSKIIVPWSSFAWDPNHGDLILYGGGHANYRGNDVYIWRGSTRQWERASLPSEMKQDPLGNWNAIDGADHAPASAHTYDNNVYLPLVDRLLVIGGAADANGGHYLRQDTATTSRKTGPYLFDPSRADPNKVGGTTGSHVKRVAPHPEVVGGQMWSNRENYLNVSQPPTKAYVNSCTAYAQEGGKDVVYVRVSDGLYKYTLHDLNNPSGDTWSKVGTYWGGPGSKTACGYDSVGKSLVRLATNGVPFVFWNLNTPGPNNRDISMTPTDPTGEFANLLASNAISIPDCGLDFDPQRNQYALWCGGGRVWMLEPSSNLSSSGWTIRKQPTPTQSVPTGDVGTGILGKWKYMPNLDVFIALQDSVQGNVWVYKPVGWQGSGDPGPSNVPPTVSISQPADGASFSSGAPIVITALASDSDGTVAKVEFFQGGTKIGEATSSPYQVAWNTAPIGSWSLTAKATDDDGAQTISSAVGVTVTAGAANVPPTVNLSQPADGASFSSGVPIVITAVASDGDGTVVKVEFFQGGTKIGEAASAPFEMSWNNAPVGSWSLTARATDDGGAQTVSSAVVIAITGPGEPAGTVILQRGLNDFSLAADSYLSNYHKTLSFGNATSLLDQGANYSLLSRFAIFHSEGGPVPNGATIDSATLSLYKYSAYDVVYGVHRILKEWQESSANWTQTGVSGSWSGGGANGVGADYAATPDATASVGWEPGWIDFDVSAAVRAMSNATPTANYGWRLRAISGYLSGGKKFYSGEYTGSPELRPKLVIRYR